MPNYSKIAGSLSELLAKLPKGSTAAQEAIRLEMELEAARQAAMYAPHTLPTEAGAEALEKAKKTIGKAEGGIVNLDDIVNKALQRAPQKMGVGGGVKKASQKLVSFIEKLAKEQKAAEKAGDIEAALQKNKELKSAIQAGVNSPAMPRAKPLSDVEIQAFAERMAPQIVGELTRGKSGAKTVAGKTQQQFQREKTLPVERRVLPGQKDPMALLPEMTLEQQKGGVLLGLPGDPTLARMELSGIGDVAFERPVTLHGGPRYGDDEKLWASNIAGASNLVGAGRRASEQYGGAPVYASFMKMPEGFGFAQHYLDSLMQYTRPDQLPKEARLALEADIRKGFKDSKKNYEFPEFAGFDDLGVVSEQALRNSKLRGHIADRLEKSKLYGLRPAGDVEFAVTHPELTNIETGAGGFTIGELPLNQPFSASAHPTYTHDIPGKVLGQTRYPTPYDLLYRDQLEMVKKNPVIADEPFGTVKLLGARQQIDEQLINEINEYQERLRRMIGKKDGGLAEGGAPEKRDVSQLFPINPNIGREPVARTRAGVPVQDTNVLGGALQGLGETLLGAGRGYAATTLGGIQDLLNMVDIPQLMTGESYQIPYGSEYFKEKLPLKPTTQTGEVAQELGSFLPLDPTQVVKSGYKAAKTVGKAIAPTAAEMALDLAEKGGAPVRQFAVPPEGKLSKEEYSRMMREKYAAENAAKQAKKEAAPVTMADLKPKEEKVPADKLGFYSPAEKAAANLKRNIADGELMLSDLKKFPDVTPDELAMTGLEEWLKGKKTVTKQQVKDYMAKNKLELEEVKYEQGTGNADDMRFGSGEVIDDHDYISSRADDIVYDWDYIGHESRDEIRARILEDADPEDAEHLIASGKIDDLVEEEVGKLANDYAADEYYDNPYRRYRNDMGYEIVGNDDVGYHVTDPNGNHVRMNREAYDVETAEGYAREDAMNRGFIDEGETKYHDYQLPGGENYREILLKTPSKKQHLEEAIRELEHSMENPGNDPRELREMQKELDKLKFDYKYAEKNAYEGSHWDEPNVIAHMRLQDRVDSEGNKILYVDEMQSDWHQEGRRTGYKTKEDSELIAKVKEKRDEASDKTNDIWNQRVQRSRELAKEFADSQDPAVKALGSTKYMENDKILNDLDNAYNEASKVLSALNKELSKYTSKVPKGPFSDNWHKLALKRVMKYAADNGYTRVGFSKAQPQVNRWGTDVVAWDKNPAGGWVVTATEQRGGRAGNINLEDDARARGILQESKVNTINNRDQLYATVAKISRGKTEEELQKLTDRIWKQMQEKDAGIVAPREAGMKKFYDEELEGALKKYANQFKGKYGQTTLDVPREGKQTINYIDITPDLKKSTTKGQPYKVGGAVRMAKGGVVNLDELVAQALSKNATVNLDDLVNQALTKKFAEGGAAYNTTPDMADGGQFIQGEAF